MIKDSRIQLTSRTKLTREITPLEKEALKTKTQLQNPLRR